MQLRIVGPDGEETYPLNRRELRIGRSANNDVVLAADKVLSRNHCQVEFRDGAHLIRDLDSKHGTWINGRRLKTQPLRYGDVIRIGRSKLYFEEPGRSPSRRNDQEPRRDEGRRDEGRRDEGRRDEGRRDEGRRDYDRDRRSPPPSERRRRPDEEVADAWRDGEAFARSGQPHDQGRDRRPEADEARQRREDDGDRHNHDERRRRDADDRERRDDDGGRRRRDEPEDRHRHDDEPGDKGERDRDGRGRRPSDHYDAPSDRPDEDRGDRHEPDRGPPARTRRYAEPNDDLEDEPPRPRRRPRSEPEDEEEELVFPAGWPAGHAPDDPDNAVQKLLNAARKRNASDVHLVPELPAVFRIDGQLEKQGSALSAETLADMAKACLTEAQLAYYKASGDFDTCYVFPAGGRFRFNACRSRLGDNISIRLIKKDIASLTEIDIPDVAKRLTTYAQGLVLVTGPMGSGKTTTMMSLVQLVNDTRKDHIITIEDPIEFVLRSSDCHVSQRELGPHTASFGAALRGALREDPDIIVVGDLRDYEVTSLACEAAETGHLVFASMHAMNCTKSLDKLVDMFPASEQAVVREGLSESLRGILCQKLVASSDGRRVAAVELLFNSTAVANCIADNKLGNLTNIMALGRNQGMRTLDYSLQLLLHEGKIEQEVALRYCQNRERFMKAMGLTEDA